MSHRLPQLLTRFKLPAGASAAELRGAYLKQAKVLHPDVAGESSEEQFRRLKEDYEEAMKLMRQGPSSAGPSAAASGGAYRAGGFKPGHAYYGGSAYHDYRQGFAWQSPPGYNNGASASAARETAEPLTPAQRLRNVLLVAGGVVAAALFLTRPAAQRESLSARLDPSAAVDAAVMSASVSNARQRERKPPIIQPVSDYYKSRTSKSTVRVRSRDSYVSPVEPSKSRSADEGLGSTATTVASMARGCSPSDARDEKPTDTRS